jgi:hypothetical protein
VDKVTFTKETENKVLHEPNPEPVKDIGRQGWNFSCKSERNNEVLHRTLSVIKKICGQSWKFACS